MSEAAPGDDGARNPRRTWASQKSLGVRTPSQPRQLRASENRNQDQGGEMTDWGGSRPGSGARRRTLIDLVHKKTFRPGRHLSLLDSDGSVVDAACLHPGATRILAAAYCQ